MPRAVEVRSWEDLDLAAYAAAAASFCHTHCSLCAAAFRTVAEGLIHTDCRSHAPLQPAPAEDSPLGRLVTSCTSWAARDDVLAEIPAASSLGRDQGYTHSAADMRVPDWANTFASADCIAVASA